MNKRTNEQMSQPYWNILVCHTRHYDSMQFSVYLWIIHTIHFYMRAQHTHTHTFFAWKWKWMFDSCYIYNKLRFVSAFAISSTGFGTDTFLCSSLSLSHSLSFIRRFLCPYTQCVNLLFLCFQTKNYPTASVIPCIREHVLYESYILVAI